MRRSEFERKLSKGEALLHIDLSSKKGEAFSMEQETTSIEKPGFYIPEGIARITRNGHTDIYLIRNQMPLGSYRVSLAYELDDFKEGQSCGHFLYLRESDAVEHLGGIKEYFISLKLTERWIADVVRQCDRSVGLLPIVRACEKLRNLKRPPTDEEIRQTAREALADYHTRRLMLNFGVRGRVEKQT